MKGKQIVIVAFVILSMAALLTGCGKKKIDVTDNLQISFEGYNGYGKAELQNAYAWEEKAFEAAGIKNIDGFGSLGNALNIEMAVTWDINPNSNLSNGDTVVVKAVVDEAALEDYDFKLIAGSEKTFTVKDLPELKEVDPFVNVEVIYEGISPNGQATVVQGGVIEYPMDFYYRAEPNNGLKNGDIITVRISNSDPEREAIEEGYRLTSLEKKFTVSGLTYYAEKLLDVPDDAIEKLKKQTEDIIVADVAKRSNSVWSKSNVYSLGNMEFLGNYFLCAKNIQSAFRKNYCYFVYKLDMVGENDFSCYYTVAYYDLLVLEDGTCSYDFDNRVIPNSVIKLSTLDYYSGFEDIDKLYNECVTQNLADYSNESTVLVN